MNLHCKKYRKKEFDRAGRKEERNVCMQIIVVSACFVRFLYRNKLLLEINDGTQCIIHTLTYMNNLTIRYIRDCLKFSSYSPPQTVD